jgi:hypothetical protein
MGRAGEVRGRKYEVCDCEEGPYRGKEHEAHAGGGPDVLADNWFC